MTFYLLSRVFMSRREGMIAERFSASHAKQWRLKVNYEHANYIDAA